MKHRKFNAEEWRPVSTALVLSGGGAKGAYEVGVIKELLQRGIKIDLVTGSSIGAFNGALFTEFMKKGYSPDKICAKLEQVWSETEKFLSLNWSGFLKNLLTPLALPSVFTNKKIKNKLLEYIPRQRRFFDYTECQLSITSTNLDKREQKIFDFNSRTCVPRAVIASMAYPVAFPSIKIGNDSLIDGGTLDNAPLKEAILWGARHIFVVFLTPLSEIEGESEETTDKLQYSALDVMDKLIDLASNKLMYGDLKTAEKINKLIRLMAQYKGELPAGFVYKIRKLFGLKSGDGKRIIRIVKIAPRKILDPPGTMGFHEQETLKKLIKRGQREAATILDG